MTIKELTLKIWLKQKFCFHKYKLEGSVPSHVKPKYVKECCYIGYRTCKKCDKIETFVYSGEL